MDNKVKRLIYQSCHRGCKEMDTILGPFAKKYLHKFSPQQLEMYEEFIKEDDWDIYAWITQKQLFPEKHINEVTDLLRNFDFAQALREQII